MKADAWQRRRDAGLMLAAACEEVLGVSGPTALAALTGRSKSWWSKLASGGAAFPTWEELQLLLPPEITAVERERLHIDYRKAWLGLYDRALLERLDHPKFGGGQGLSPLSFIQVLVHHSQHPWSSFRLVGSGASGALRAASTG